MLDAVCGSSPDFEAYRTLEAIAQDRHGAEAGRRLSGWLSQKLRILERDLESKFPDPNREIIMYCGGGYRSILTAAAAQKMGYRNIFSLKGGYKGLLQSQWPMKSD